MKLKKQEKSIPLDYVPKRVCDAEYDDCIYESRTIEELKDLSRMEWPKMNILLSIESAIANIREKLYAVGIELVVYELIWNPLTTVVSNRSLFRGTNEFYEVIKQFSFERLKLILTDLLNVKKEEISGGISIDLNRIIFQEENEIAIDIKWCLSFYTLNLDGLIDEES